MEKQEEKSEARLGSLEELMIGTGTVKDEDAENSAPLEEIGESSMTEGDEVKQDSSLKDDTTQEDEIEIPGVETEIVDSEKPKKEVGGGSKSEEYRSTLIKLFGDRVSTIVFESENGEDEEVLLDEIEIDEEMFEEISKQVIASIESSASEGKISVKGLSDTAKRLIEIDRQGGDITQLLNLQKRIMNPLETLDVENNESDQVKVIFMRQRASNVPDEDIKALIRVWKSDGLLEEKALIAESELKEYFNRQLKLKEEQMESQRLAYEEEQKKFRKSFRDSMGLFQLNKSAEKKLSDFVLKEDPSTGLRDMDHAYREMRNNPELAVSLGFFLMNKKEYDKQVSSEMVKQAKLETAAKVRVVRMKSEGRGTGSKAKSDSALGDLDELRL